MPRGDLSRIKTSVLAALLVIVPAVLPSQTVTSLKSGEATTVLTKHCLYQALGSEYTRTFSSVTLCPLTIQVKLP